MPLTESLRFDWTSLGATRSAEGVPAAIERLRDAQTVEEADHAFRQISGVVERQRTLYEAAEHTIPCLLSVLPDCSAAGRSRAFDLLYELGAGGSGPEDPTLDERCRAAVKHGVAMYFYYLEHGTPEESGFCADLIELCAQDDKALALRARWWLQRLLPNIYDDKLKKVYQTCLKEIEASLEAQAGGS